MTMKIKLTQEQADFIEKSLANGIDKEEMLNRFAKANCFEKQPRHSLHGLCVMDLARALLIGYEVEEKQRFVIGEWKRYRKNDCLSTVGQVSAVDTLEMWVRFEGDFKRIPFSNIERDATPEEIKAGKERQKWAEIGRGVGEFRESDTGFDYDGILVPGITALSQVYSRGELQGFYPAESYVNLVEVEPNATTHN